MGFPTQRTTLVSLAGGLGLTAMQGEWSRGLLLKAFAALWFVQLVGWFVWRVFVWPFFVSPLRSLPGPKGKHWLWGHGMRILKEVNGRPMKEWIANVPNDGLIRYFWFFNIERILVTSPKALAEVLVTNNYAFKKPRAVRESIGRILGFGVLLAEGDEHRTQRRQLMPAFAFRHVKELYPVFWRKSCEVVQAMTETCGPGGETGMEIYGWASRCTLDIIGLAGMGRDFGAIKDEGNSLVKTYQNLFKSSRQAMILGLLGTLVPAAILSRIPVRRNEDINVAAGTIRAVCLDLIREKRAKLANKEQPDLDILSVAIESGQFSDEGLVDQLMTFLAAGHETTATAMTWAVYMLCLHPEMQTKLRAEVRERLPSVDANDADDAPKVTSTDVDRMPYLNAFCSEVLRYYSPVPMTLREAAHDTTIQGQAVPKGTRVILSVWGNNMDSHLWGGDAAEFKPERWMAGVNGSGAGEGGGSSGGGGASSNYAYMTFLHGPRSCIGQSFAKAEFACLLAAWVGRFEFELQDQALMDETKMDIKSGVTARPSDGLLVKTRVVEGY